jgi:hypothetical protein
MLQQAFNAAPQLTGFILLLILIGFVVAVGAALAMVGRAGWGLLVSMNRMQKTVLTPAVEIMEHAEQAAERADRLALKAEELDGAVVRLRENVAALAVLTETLEKASQPWLRLRKVLRK